MIFDWVLVMRVKGQKLTLWLFSNPCVIPCHMSINCLFICLIYFCGFLLIFADTFLSLAYYLAVTPLFLDVEMLICLFDSVLWFSLSIGYPLGQHLVPCVLPCSLQKTCSYHLSLALALHPCGYPLSLAYPLLLKCLFIYSRNVIVLGMDQRCKTHVITCQRIFHSLILT